MFCNNSAEVDYGSNFESWMAPMERCNTGISGQCDQSRGGRVGAALTPATESNAEATECTNSTGTLWVVSGVFEQQVANFDTEPYVDDMMAGVTACYQPTDRQSERPPA